MIRDARPADVGVVGELIKALADYEQMADEVEWDEARLADSLFGPDAVPEVLLAVEGDDPDGPVVGMAIWFRTYSTFEGRAGIWLEDLFVRPDARGAGHGRALLDALFGRAGDGRVEWVVLDWNEPSIRFYDSLGAKPVAGWTRYRWKRG